MTDPRRGPYTVLTVSTYFIVLRLVWLGQNYGTAGRNSSMNFTTALSISFPPT